MRDWVLTGVWGREVHVVTDEVRYAAAPAGDNAPLSMWSNRWSTMPVHAFPQLRLPRPDGRAVLARMPGSDVPVIRQPFVAGDLLPFWAAGGFEGNHCYDRPTTRPRQRNLAGDTVGARPRPRPRGAAQRTATRSRRPTISSLGSGWPETAVASGPRKPPGAVRRGYVVMAIAARENGSSSPIR